MPGSVILAGARTPIGKLSGSLAGFSGTDLGGLAIKAALERAGVAGSDVDSVGTGSAAAGPTSVVGSVECAATPGRAAAVGR